MAMKHAGIGIAVLAMTGIAMTGFGASAYSPFAQERIVSYWNNAQHSIEIGQRVSGPCDGYANWGSTSNFSDVSYESCRITP